MDKMPDEVYVSDGKYQLLVYKRPVDPLKGTVSYPRVKYRRKDLPKEVDLMMLQMKVTAKMGTEDEKFAVSKVFGHLVALGVIKDINVKPAENKADRSET